jgi:hypothetical protein
MKKLALIIIGIAILLGCKKEAKHIYPMYALINGVPFIGDSCVASLDNVGNLVIYGGSEGLGTTPPDIKIFIININGPAVGVYNIGPPTVYNLYFAFVDSASGSDASTSGVVNVTSVSPYITGTFSFATDDGTKVTNGSFSAKAP